MRKERLKLLSMLLSAISETKELYGEATPAWILLNSAFGFINSVHMLEENGFDEKTLGVRNFNNS